MSLGTSPAYLAFLREVGIEDALDRSDTQGDIDRLIRRRDRALPEIAEEGGFAREGISGAMEDRGIYRSGEHEVALARQRAREGRTVAGLEAETAESVDDLRSRLERDIAARRRRTAEAGLSAAGDVYGMVMG